MYFPDFNPKPYTLIWNLQGAIGASIIFLLIVWNINFLLLSIYMPKRFDPLLGDLVIGGWVFGKWMKGGMYGTLVAAPKFYRRLKGAKLLFGDFNFKKHVTKFERTISKIHLYSIYTMIIGVILYLIIYLIFCFE
ncbi:MAG: hypothetical protein JSR33_05860 [Proteobacteria bacterium]|nr:hypothetical protein [Pseudomonadota bacterium]